jgi:hypothetical protein
MSNDRWLDGVEHPDRSTLSLLFCPKVKSSVIGVSFLGVWNVREDRPSVFYVDTLMGDSLIGVSYSSGAL